MDVDHGQLGFGVRAEECFLVVVETYECVEEGGGCGGEIHDVVIEGFGLLEGLPAGWRLSPGLDRGALRTRWFGRDVDALFVVQKLHS